MKKKLALSVILSLILLISFALPILAIDDPDDPPSIEKVYVYQDLLEDGDVGVLIHYFIDYTIAGIPTETVTEAYLAIFIDTDGTTQLKSEAPYVFVDSGYGHGLVWIYFTADEVTDYSITSASVADYEIWLTGNPTLSWVGDPPKTISTIDDWKTTGDASTWTYIDLITFADYLELQWSLDLVESTANGNKFTSTGESYFENVIDSLRTISPSCFADSELQPIIENIDYTTEFGAVLTDNTGTANGSPITLAQGDNTITITGLGTFDIELESGTYGTATSGGVCLVTGSPVDLIPGTNTITTAGAIGTITVSVDLESTQGKIDDTITGTMFDLSDVADSFGISTSMFGGFVWIIITIIVSAACFKIPNFPGKGLFIVFEIMVIGGALLGLLPVLVAVLLFIAFGFIAGYVFFYRGANF